MNELLGILLPLLASGAGIGDLLRVLGGQSGASGMDGLSAMLSSSSYNARMHAPMRPNQETIDRVVEARIGNMGFDPYSQCGQAMSAFIGSMYHLAPDLVGGIIGVPNSGRFFSTIANGASGIGMAAGYGQSDIFNPYSVMTAHKRAMDLAKIAHGLGTDKDGGYDISYGHGLNMEEMGLVTQRLLSSRVAYREIDKDFKETGRTLDYTDAPREFEENLRKLGSEFNRAVSMMSKVTGDVGKTIDMLDRISGGNFLGGTAEQARKVADRAMNMATAIRVTSAMAGMDPRRAFARMEGIMAGMAGGMGLDPSAANASGFSSAFGRLAYQAQMGYNAWAAANQVATPAQKQAAELAVYSRATSFMNANGSAYAAMIADNAGKFTQEELSRIESDMMNGTPEASYDMVKSRMGNQLFNAYMTNPAFKVAAMERANRENPDMLDRFMGAGMSGNLEQAEKRGARTMTELTLGGLDDALYKATGNGGFGKEREKAVREHLAIEARDKLGLTLDHTKKWTADQLREILRKRGKYDEAEENLVRIREASEQIDANTMTAEEEEAAKSRLASMIEASGMTEDKKKELTKKLGSGGSLDSVMDDFAATENSEAARENLKREVYGNKMSRERAEQEKSNLERLDKAQNGEYSDKERMDALETEYNRRRLNSTGSRLAGLAKAGSFQDFSEQAGKLGISSEEVDSAYSEAAKRVVSGIIGSGLGDMEGKELDNLKTEVADTMRTLIDKGYSANDAFKAAMQKAKEKEGIGESGKKAVDKIIENSSVKNEDLLSTAKSVIDERQGKEGKDLIDRMRKLSEGDFGDMNDVDAYNEFIDLAKKSGLSEVSEEELENIRESGLESLEKNPGSASTLISQALSKIRKTGQSRGNFAAFAGANAGKANELIAAMMYKSLGGDVSGFGFTKEVVDAVSGLDDARSEKMNAVSSAWGVGGNGFAKTAIESTEKRMEALYDTLKSAGVSEDQVRLYASGDEDAKKLVEKAVSSDSDRSLLRTLGGGAKIGDRDALEAMFEGKGGVDRAKKAAGDNKGDEAMLDIARKSGRGEGQAYEVMTQLGDFIKKIAPFFQDPERTFNVNVVNKL